MDSRSPGTDELARLYDEGLSYEDIARRLGVTRTSVMRWFKAAGIPPRTRSEAHLLAVKKYPANAHQRSVSRANSAKARAGITRESYEKMVATRQARGVNYRSGSDNHFWRGGVARTISTRAWAKIARQCYERDGWLCRDCGVKCLPKNEAVKVDARLWVQAHHQIARRNGGGDELGNLVTLCLSCHRKREAAFADALFA